MAYQRKRSTLFIGSPHLCSFRKQKTSIARRRFPRSSLSVKTPAAVPSSRSPPLLVTNTHPPFMNGNIAGVYIPSISANPAPYRSNVRHSRGIRRPSEKQTSPQPQKQKSAKCSLKHLGSAGTSETLSPKLPNTHPPHEAFLTNPPSEETRLGLFSAIASLQAIDFVV